jgi:hypothetical protein
VRLEGLDKLKKMHLIGTRTRDLPAVPQPTALPRVDTKQRLIAEWQMNLKGF